MASSLGVLVQETHPAEGFVATGAGILFGLQVGLEVSPEIGLVGKAPGAIVAPERLLAGVSAHVALKQPRPRETLAASLAFAWQSVRSDVHLERREASVALGAVVARESLLDLVGAVELLVLGVSALSRETLFAFQTMEGLGHLVAPGLFEGGRGGVLQGRRGGGRGGQQQRPWRRRRGHVVLANGRADQGRTNCPGGREQVSSHPEAAEIWRGHRGKAGQEMIVLLPGHYCCAVGSDLTQDSPGRGGHGCKWVLVEGVHWGHGGSVAYCYPRSEWSHDVGGEWLQDGRRNLRQPRHFLLQMLLQQWHGGSSAEGGGMLRNRRQFLLELFDWN